MPYWLDNFGIALSKWMNQLGSTDGYHVTVLNPNASSSAQVTILSTAIASQKYSLILWQPIDVAAELPIAKQIQAAKIPQVVFGVNLDAEGFSVPSVNFNQVQHNEVLANLGAQAVNKYLHQSPKIVFFTGLPLDPICQQQLQGMKAGLAKVDPNAKIVYQQGIQDSSQANATTAMADFLTRNIPFNMTMGCGDTVDLGMMQALKAAGHGTATNKVPKSEVVVFEDGTPAGLQYLWSANSSAMFDSLLPPKNYTTDILALGQQLLDKSIPLNSNKSMLVDALPLTADCATSRAAVAAQYAGVSGLTVPQCSFSYNQAWTLKP